MPEDSSQEARDIVEAIEAALCDDLNTPQAVALLSDPLKMLNDLLHTRKVRAIPTWHVAALPARWWTAASSMDRWHAGQESKGAS